MDIPGGRRSGVVDSAYYHKRANHKGIVSQPGEELKDRIRLWNGELVINN